MTLLNEHATYHQVDEREARKARIAAVQARVAAGIIVRTPELTDDKAIIEGIFGSTAKADWSDASLAPRKKFTNGTRLPSAKKHVKMRNKFTSQREANDAYGTLRASGKIERSSKGAKPGKRVRRIADEQELRNIG